MEDADPLMQQAGEGLAESCGEPELADGRRDDVAFGAGCDIDAGEGLRVFERGGLREMDDIDRRLATGEQIGDRLVQRRERVVVMQRDRTFGSADDDAVPTGAAAEIT